MSATAVSTTNRATRYGRSPCSRFPISGCGWPRRPSTAQSATTEDRLDELVDAQPRIDLAKPDPALLERIRRAQPDLVLVALGSPKQELWIHRNREALRPAVLLGIGATLDFLAGPGPASAWLDFSRRTGVGLPPGAGAAASGQALSGERSEVRRHRPPDPPRAASPENYSSKINRARRLLGNSPTRSCVYGFTGKHLTPVS